MSAPVQRRAPAGEANLGKAYDMRLMRRLARFVWPHWRLLIVSALLIPLTIALDLAQPYVVKVAIVDHIAVGDSEGLGVLALVFLGLVAAQSVSAYVEQWAIQLLGQRSMHDLRLAIYDHVLGRRAAFFDRMPVGRLMTRMTNDIESLNEMFAAGVVTLFADAIKMIAIAVIMFTIDWQLTLITFVTLPLLVILVNYARSAMRASFRVIRVRLAAMNAFVQEHLLGIKVVQIFRREDAAAGEYDMINAGHRDAYLVSIRADAAMYALVEAIGILAIALVAWWAARDLGVSGETIATVGVVVVFIEYINKFFIPVRDLSAKYAVMQGAMAATERIVELLDTEEADAPPTVTRPVAQTDAAVTFDKVEFAYGDEPVLRGVSFEIPRGKTVAIVGATGSGKSTLIKLLTRLYEIGDGAITIDGVDIRSLPPPELRRRVTVVSQDAALFAGTVSDNVALGAVASGRTATSSRVAVRPEATAPSATLSETVPANRAASCDTTVTRRRSSGGGRPRMSTPSIV
ncbi:MAG: ATP-binding cassette domain-containing protein, partial [Deltaproteobacteria bacterium]|nr:ATP-binding cassette domain-containing protein [Kofleriaceae bacterium]